MIYARRTALALSLAILMHWSGHTLLAAEPAGEIKEAFPTEWLFPAGKLGYPRYRIPALLVTPKKTLLAFCEGRIAGRGLTGDIDLVLRRSLDSGKTWGPLEVIAKGGGDTLGNPCPVIDQSTGILWLLLTISPGEKTEEQITDGETKTGTRVLITSSSDDGKTWAAPQDISAQARRPEWTWYGTGPGVGIQLANGRLLIPSYHTEPKTKIYKSHALFSDDHGKTWQIGESLGDHTSESAALQRGDGSVYYSARTVIGKEERTVANSADGGAHFQDVRLDSTLFDPHCQGSLLAIMGPPRQSGQAVAEGKPIWLYCHPAGPQRRNLTIRLSTDEGKTWPGSKLLVTGDAQYSSLAELPDGTIGCLFEAWREKNYQLYFMRIERDWLLK